MARPAKETLDYFPLNTDLESDPDIQVLEEEFGNDGFATLIKMWARAYRSPGGEIDLSTEVRVKLLAKLCNISTSKWLKIIRLCVELGLFSEQKFSEKRLSSGGVKKRIQKILDERERAREKGANRKSNKINGSDELPDGTTTEQSRSNSGEPHGKGKGNTEKEKESIESESGQNPPGAIPNSGKPYPEYVAKRPRDAAEVEYYYVQKKVPDAKRMALKFFAQYEGNGWVQGGGAPIKNWKAQADSYAMRQEDFSKPAYSGGNSPSRQGQVVGPGGVVL